MDMIVPPTLLAVLVVVVVVVSAGVVVVFWRDAAQSFHFSKMAPPQYQQAAPLTS